MSAINVKQTESRSRKKIGLQVAVGLLLVLLLLVATAYFTVTSNAFFQYFVVPKISAALNASFKVTRAHIHPFSLVQLDGITIAPKGREQLLTAQTVSVRCSVLSLLRGNINLDEVSVLSPEISLVERADGSSNLDALLKAQKPASSKPSQTTQPSKPPTLSIKSVKVTGAKIRRVQQHPTGGEAVTEISQLSLKASNIKNNTGGTAEISAGVALQNSLRAGPPTDSLLARLSGSFNFSLATDLQPTSLNGDSSFHVESATGSLTELEDFTANLHAETTPAEIKTLSLKFTRAATPLGELRLNGPFDADKREAKLKFEVVSLGSQVLNLLAANSGLDFGGTSINASSDVELTKNGNLLSLIGNLSVAQFQASRAGQSTPTLDLKCEYSLAVDRSAKSALLGLMNIVGTQDKKPLLQAGLTGPMTLAWADTAEATADSSLLLSVSDFNLAQWKPLIGDLASGGLAKCEFKVTSQQTGRALSYNLKVTGENLALLAGGRKLAALNASLEAAGDAKDLQQFKVTEINGQVSQRGQPLLSIQGSASYDVPQAVMISDVTVISSLSDLLPTLAIPDTDATAGALEIQTRFLQKTNTQTLNGRFRLAGFSGIIGGTAFLNYSTDADFELRRDPRRVQLKRFTGRLHEGSKLGGIISITGNYDDYTTAADVSVKLTDFNQYGLRPLLESAFGNRRLTAAGMTSTVTASRNPAGDATIKAELQLTNIITVDLKTAIATTPLEVRAQLDASVSKQIAQIRKGQITLTPTQRSKNILTLTANVDMSKAEVVSGNVKLAADTLDLTKYLDLFAEKPKAASPRATAQPAATEPSAEPEAEKLPFHNFVCELNIGRIYAREVDATGLQTVATLDNNHLYLKPCKVALNGAPVIANANVDFGVPGYTYDLGFSARDVALAPLVNTFQPERRGQVSGQATLTAQFTGAGITGTNLQRNLTGELYLLSTNLNLSLGNVRSPIIMALVNTVVGIPDLLRNPGGALENLVGRFANFGAPRGGWADDLMSAPLQSIEAKVVAGGGKVQLQTAEVRSSAFKAKATGGIGIAPILTNSTINVPVSLSLSHNLALKIGLVPAGAPTNAAYYAMPDFFTMRGTIGKPEPKTDRAVLAGLVARASAGVLKQLGIAGGDAAKSIIQTGGGIINSLLGGPKRTEGDASSVSSTNAPDSSPPKTFDLFGAPEKKP